jgi:hypothetical protein
MVLHRASPFASNSFEEVVDFAVPPVQYLFASQDHDNHRHQSSNDQNNGMTSANDYAHTTVGNVPFSPWVFEVPPSSSHLSRSSSLSGSEYVSTPPPYIEQSPMYNMMPHSLPLPAGYMAVNSPELTWQPHLTEGRVCNSQPPMVQPPLLWTSNDHGSMPLAPMEYYLHSPPVANVTTRSHQVGIRPHAPFHGLPATPADNESIIASSDPKSDDEDDEDCSSIYARQKRGSSEAENAICAGFLKLGPWTMANDPFTHPPARNYVCPRFGQPDSEGRPCTKGFVRPEHLRRHVRTVHSKYRPFHCKVPNCEKKFSRGDNMRDHYWTHIERGGRAGKNQKMIMPELFAILGPKEKALKWRLRLKLAKVQARQQRPQRPQVRSKL